MINYKNYDIKGINLKQNKNKKKPDMSTTIRHTT